MLHYSLAMPEPRIQPKIFTLEGANTLLPTVRSALTSLRQSVTQVLALEARVDAITLISDTAERSPEFAQESDDLEQARATLQHAYHCFEQLGCLLKDIDIGLVDFYARLGGELVLLCWQEDEDAIRYWHNVDEGYAGRHALDEF